MSVSVEARHYLSSQHLFAADHFTRLAMDFERDHVGGPERLYLQHRAYVMGAVFEATAFLEAFVNEIFQDAADGHTGATSGLNDVVIGQMAAAWKNIERHSILAKCEKARALAAGPEAATEQSPHDDITCLIDLRNWLTHNKPRNVGERRPDELIDRVRGRFALTPFLSSPQRVAWFPNHALSAGCALWATSSVRAFAEDFVTAIGSTRSHHRLTHDEQP